jgi:hypothetical protein
VIKSAEAKARKSAKMREWRKANREKLRAYAREWLAKNKEQNAPKAAIRNARYYAKQGEQVLARKRDRYAALDPEQRLKYSGFDKTNPELVRKRLKALRDWIAAHPGYSAAQVAKRRAAVLMAMPPWADLVSIRKVYQTAKQLQALDGIPRQVDHVIPLRGKNVCGLHVAANLQVITAKENREKGARYAVS